MKESKKDTGASGMAGRKDDEGKPRMDLIPVEALDAMAKVFAFGAKKYADRNWELGMANGRLYGALQRHLTAFWGGDNMDDESGMPHLWHAMTTLAMLLTLEERGQGEDTRR